MGEDTSEWAGGANDKERKRNKLDNALTAASWIMGEPEDLTRSKIDEVNDAARIWKWNARHYRLEYRDPKSDAEAFALPEWAPLLDWLRSLGLPMQRIRSLARGQTDGGPFRRSAGRVTGYE